MANPVVEERDPIGEHSMDDRDVYRTGSNRGDSRHVLEHLAEGFASRGLQLLAVKTRLSLHAFAFLLLALNHHHFGFAADTGRFVTFHFIRCAD